MTPNPSVEATRNGMGRSSASGLSSPPRPMPLRAPHLQRYASNNTAADAPPPANPVRSGSASAYTCPTLLQLCGDSKTNRPLEFSSSQPSQTQLMNVTTVITVQGTTRSERAGGLDAGEVSQFTIEPGQYEASVSSPSDLIDHISHTSYLRGEWISSLRIGQVDVVEGFIRQALGDCQGDIDDVVQALLEEGMFCNADAGDLRSLVLLVANALSAE